MTSLDLEAGLQGSNPANNLPPTGSNGGGEDANDKDKPSVTDDDVSSLLKGSVTTVSSDGAVDPIIEAKVALANQAIQLIGMGRYQWQLFVLTGFGWAADNLWLQGVAIILPQVGAEFSPPHQQFLTLTLYVGLIVGATTWGFGADIIGRRLAFNLTLFISSVFGIATAGSNSFIAVASLVAVVGFGTGGNLPVDGAVFLEFTPQSHQYLLTVLSVWWPLGLVVASVVGWGFVGNYSCPPDAIVCTKEDNMGWRYTFYMLGSLCFLMFVGRFVIFHLYETPKFLLGQGRDAEAVEVIHALARKNRKTTPLTVGMLERVGAAASPAGVVRLDVEPGQVKPSTLHMAMASLRKFDISHVRALFASKKLAFSTSLTILLWGMIGLAYPLYNAYLPIYLQKAGANTGDGSTYTTYRNYVIISVCGIPGSLIGGFSVEINRLGRKGTMSIATLLTGVFLFLFTTARTESAVLGFNCASSLTQNLMYGVLFAYTPEIFPSTSRGTGSGMCSCFNRICGLMAPIISVYSPGDDTNVPLYVSASLFIAAGLLMILLPYESRGKASL